MELCVKLVDNPDVEFVINKIRKQSKTLSKDVVCAFNQFCDNKPMLTEEDVKCLNRAFIMCKYMEPAAEDVISMLLYRESLLNKTSPHKFMQYFSEKRYEYYFNYMYDACRNAPVDENGNKEESVAFFIMMRVCDKMFKDTMRYLNKKGTPNTILISNAYSLARKAHYWTCRKSGVPYIVHPISVANILVEFGSESPVIAAALLHDVVEDTAYSLKDIEDTCGFIVAQYVDAVTSVHKEYTESHHQAEYQCDKTQLDAKSLEKLVNAISSNREMIFALHIKAADRIHNLMTIDAMSSVKIFNKDDETQLDYLPLFEKFKLDYFVSRIRDLTWRSREFERYEEIKSRYIDMLNRNRDCIEDFKSIMRSNIEYDINDYLEGITAGYDVDIHERDYLPSEVFELIKQTGALGENPDKFKDPHKLIDKKIVPICDIDIILEPHDSRATLDTFVSGFAKMFEKRIASTGRVITDFYTDEDNRFILKVEDRYRNTYRCCIVMHDDYIERRNGVGFVSISDVYDDDEISDDAKINVQLRNGKIISLPKGSTVIDVAYAIHEEVGHAVRSATINGKEATIYNTLFDGDKVVVKSDTCREDGVTTKLIYHVRISWLNYVATKRARTRIIEYLTKIKYFKFEGDDPKKMNDAADSVVNNAADKILDQLNSST